MPDVGYWVRTNLDSLSPVDERTIGLQAAVAGGRGTGFYRRRNNRWTPGDFTELFNVKDYGALGDGATDDATAIQAAINASSAGGTVFFPPGTYRTTATAVVSYSNVFIKGAGLGLSKILMTGNASPFNAIHINGGAIGTPTSLTTATSAGARLLALGTVVASPNELIYVHKLSPTDPDALYTVITKISSLSGTTVTLEMAMPFGISTTDTHQIAKFSPTVNGVSDLTIDGSSASGAITRAINASNTEDSTFERLRIVETGQGGFLSLRGFNNRYEGITLTRCTTPTDESDFDIQRNTGSLIRSIISLDSKGFGPKVTMCSYCMVEGIHSHGANNRGIKLHTLASCTVDGLISNVSGSTGIAVTNGCISNRFNNLISVGHQSGSGNDIGIWLSDQGNNGNAFNNVVAYGNTDFDIDVNASDLFNFFSNVRADPAKVRNAGLAIISNFMHHLTGAQYGYFDANDGALGGPIIRLMRRSASPVAVDILGVLQFWGYNAVNSPTQYGSLVAEIAVNSAGREDGNVYVQCVESGAMANFAEWSNATNSGETSMLVRTNRGTKALQRVTIGNSGQLQVSIA